MVFARSANATFGLPAPAAHGTIPGDPMTSIWLDTDIGDDIDDILALALICASPELELAGISTVLGDTAARARLARTFLAAVPGLPSVPVGAGCGFPLPGPVPPGPWPNGPARRRAGLSQLACALPARRLPGAPRRHGVDLLADRLRARPGATIPVAIGPLTNIATLLLREPGLATAIPRLVVMGGEFRSDRWEWNVRCDPLAAACVARSGILMDFIPWQVGMDCTVTAPQLRRLLRRGSPAGRLLARAVRLWRAVKGPSHARERPHLFDPMAVAVLLHPGWFRWRRGRVSVALEPGPFSRTLFTPDPGGPHRVAWGVDGARAVSAAWSRILSL